jgi:hypothetical protein
LGYNTRQQGKLAKKKKIIFNKLKGYNKKIALHKSVQTRRAMSLTEQIILPMQIAFSQKRSFRKFFTSLSE